MFEYFYNEIFRSVIIGFGSLFNDIEVRHKNDQDQTWSEIKVPLAYGPTQKFLARMQQEADLNKPIQMTLPRMSFEFTNLSYDPSRKSTKNQSFTVATPDGQQVKRIYSPVPYNMTFNLSVYSKLNDDMLQITEQILPYFQPSYNLSIKFLGNLNEIRDIPIVLENITMEDDYEGTFETRRALVYTFTFTAKTYLFGPVTDVTGDIIKKVTVGYLASSTDGTVATRDLTYQVTPRATKDYDGSVVTNLSQNVQLGDGDIEVNDGTTLTEGTYIYIGQEEMYVEKISGNTIRVKRGQDNTVAQQHVGGAPVYSITEADDKLIEFGDDFGFNGNIF
tara:strand:+ start:9401 stop:10402 length:1002 start_codon:yes stop_codon:yes gene_type:complete